MPRGIEAARQLCRILSSLSHASIHARHGLYVQSENQTIENMLGVKPNVNETSVFLNCSDYLHFVWLV